MKAKTKDNDRVLKAAWDIAKTLRDGGAPTTAQIGALRAGVKIHARYKDQWEDQAELTGVD